jgi:hypothetical protein
VTCWNRRATDPYGRWCGGRGLNPSAYPIGQFQLFNVVAFCRSLGLVCWDAFRINLHALDPNLSFATGESHGLVMCLQSSSFWGSLSSEGGSNRVVRRPKNPG